VSGLNAESSSREFNCNRWSNWCRTSPYTTGRLKKRMMLTKQAVFTIKVGIVVLNSGVRRYS